ncbi:chondroitinase-B domain-containing protein [Mariniflexile aquimaris]|uniref:Chondroitinase-B domain-containing protein n=1 Tax=Mariniflexile aquimaris TaxID=881009 RepID=A0ABW3BQT7_9FLAO
MRKLVLIIAMLFAYVAQSQIVSNNTELQNALSNATAGSTIILANGVWSNTVININKTGTAANPITIKAQNAGQVFLEGKPQISLGGTYIVFEGFTFRNPSNLVSVVGTSKTTIEPIIEFRDASNNVCNNCKVTNIKIDSFNGTSAQATDTFKWIIIYGQYNEISHSSFIGKNGVGSIINDNRDNANANYSKIHHNYFGERIPVDNNINGLNDQDAIRIGNSATSLSDSYTEVYNNFFYDWSGEIEIISNKSGKNKYYNNTFRDYQGTLTLRHGNNSEVYGNYFFANNNEFSGGIRVIGEGHKIYNNYIEGTNYKKPGGSGSDATGGINVSNGTVNSALNEYYQVKNVQITNNTLVNCDLAIRIGTTINGTTLAPENLIVANNIMLNSSIKAVSIVTAPIGTSEIKGNITQNGSWDLTNNVNSNKTVTSGLLTSGTSFYRLLAASAAIDAGIDTYSFLTEDILGSSRSNTSFDAGAEEYGGSGTNLPYVVEDVSVKIGFLSNPNPYISLSTNRLDFNKAENSGSFDISSNVSWIVSDNASWVTFNPSSGSNGGTITVNIAENTTGSDRTATITVSQNGGSESSTLTINQSSSTFNPNNAVKLTGITVTGVGTQVNSEINPENTLDGITTTRWSGESTTGSAYLTYNLQCLKTVTSVKIYFHKGSERASYFKIATSTDGVNFTDATVLLTSSGTTVGFEDFPLTANPLAQYVRILGYGNSSPGGWNSYEEVEIYGDNTCSSLSVNNAVLKSNDMLLYPIPTIDGYVTLKSDKNVIGEIKIFDLLGKLLYTQNIKLNTEKIDVSFLSKGVYILKTTSTTKRFVVN